MDKRVTNPLKEIEKPSSENAKDGNVSGDKYLHYNTSDGVVISDAGKYIQVSKDDRLKALYINALKEINEYLTNTESNGIEKKEYTLDIVKTNMENPLKNGGNG